MIQLTTETLRSKHINYNELSLPQRIILNNGGSLTKLMEVLMDESIVLNKILEKHTKTEINIPELALERGKSVMFRKITLQGARSKNNWIYAESLIALDHLNNEFSYALTDTNTPIGRIWEMLKVETYKKLVSWGEEKASKTSEYFNISPEDKLLYRTYQVYSDKVPIMLITEKFPAAWYSNDLILSQESYDAA